MQKKQYWNVKTLVFMALLIAMHLVLTRVLVIDLGAYRISVGSVCTILAGLWLGPVAGGVCGLCADIIGCFMKGYAVNPFITVAAILWGVLPALRTAVPDDDVLVVRQPHALHEVVTKFRPVRIRKGGAFLYRRTDLET